MLKKRTYKNLSWIDLTSPTNKEVRELVDDGTIDPRVAEEILPPITKPKLIAYNKTVFLVLHFPAIRHTHSNERNQEVDFVISKDTLITVHYDTVDSIERFTKEFEVTTILDKKKSAAQVHAGYIFSHLVQSLYQSLQHELDFVESKLGDIEDNVFKGKERQMVQALSRVSRILLDMEQTVEGHERSLKDLLNEGQRIFGSTFTQELQDILHHYHAVYYRIKDQREFLTELRTTNDSLLSAKQNEVMKTLTIMAFVTFPLTLIAGIFGMNTERLPIVGAPGDFWIIIGIMSVLAAIMFIYFKHNRWL